MENSQLLYILVIAMVAGVVLFRLYSVLGRRTGNEREPGEKWRFGRLPRGAEPTPVDNVIPLPVAPRAEAEAPDDPTARGLLDIKLADKDFETEHFLAGARHAYEMIVTAYASGDRATLQPLLSDEVHAAFETVMRAREARDEKVNFTFVGFKSAKITHAGLKGRTAEITLEFAAQYISSTVNGTGQLVDGDTKSVRDVVDVWSFARDVRASDPNWMLVATTGGA
jgi:predicted lipid-binding transport protein (Tim44 family)